MPALHNYCAGPALCSSLPSQGHAYFMGPCPYKPVVRRKITGNHRGIAPTLSLTNHAHKPQVLLGLSTHDS